MVIIACIAFAASNSWASPWNIHIKNYHLVFERKSYQDYDAHKKKNRYARLSNSVAMPRSRLLVAMHGVTRK